MATLGPTWQTGDGAPGGWEGHSASWGVCGHTRGGHGPQAVSPYGISGLCSHCTEDALLPPGGWERPQRAATAGALLVPSQPSPQEVIPEMNHHRALKSPFYTCQISPTRQRLKLVKWGQSRVGGKILVIFSLNLLPKYLIS